MAKIVQYILLSGLLLLGCASPVPSENDLWQVRSDSLGRAVRAGVTVEQVLAIWGKADRVSQSVAGQTHYGTLYYERYVNQHGVRFSTPIESYSFEFVDGRLQSWHRW